MTVRLRLDIAYDGTDFSGWAAQPGQRTVAGVLGEALRTLLRAPTPMVVAGRTDAGVHAIGQVAHIDVAASALLALTPRHLAHHAASPAPQADHAQARPAPQPGSVTGTLETEALAGALVGLQRRLAGLLPPDVRTWRIGVAPSGFDARFSALRRHYRYRIHAGPWGVPPHERAYTLWSRKNLDTAAMQTAADQLLGLHDFAAYCKPREGSTTVRELQQLDIVPLGGQPHTESDGSDRPSGSLLSEPSDPLLGQPSDQVIDIRVAADAFCHSMVRSLVGALLAVGEGRREPSAPAELLAARQRTADIAVAPAHGLTLMAVDYPEPHRFAARAAQTRAVRSPCAPGGER